MMAVKHHPRVAEKAGNDATIYLIFPTKNYPIRRGVFAGTEVHAVFVLLLGCVPLAGSCRVDFSVLSLVAVVYCGTPVSVPCLRGRVGVGGVVRVHACSEALQVHAVIMAAQ